MKKTLLCALSALLLAACSSEEPGFKGDKEETPSTEVYAMGKQLLGTSTATQSMMAPAAAATANYTNAYYYIRIDGRIPKSHGSYNSNEYWPQTTAGRSVFAEANSGTVNLDYPYWCFSKDYYTRQYVYDTTGEAVAKVLGNVPTFQSMMTVNQKDTDDVAKIDTKGLKIIWYVAKLVENKWHVDGVLTYEDVKDVTEVPGISQDKDLSNKADEMRPELGKGNIEVDVHQQEHSNWQEIKTSVHLRDLVESVIIDMPIGESNIAEATGFAVRTYDLDLGAKTYINGTEYALDSTKPVKVTIEHKADKVVYTVECKDARYLNALRKEYNDGATVEIHTFVKDLTKEAVWAKLKESKVYTDPMTYEGLIYKGPTSAFFKE